MWISTQGGLSKYDGNTFLNYTSREGLAGSDVLCCYEDNDKNLWIGTNGFGVSKFNGSKFITYSSKNGLGNDIVNGIYRDGKNRMWFATQNGITMLEGGKFTTFDSKNGLETTDYFSITEDKTGTIWFGSKEKGVFYFKDGKFQRHNDANFSNLTVFSIYCDKQGIIWAGTPGKGLWYLNKNGKFLHFEDEFISNEFISSIKQDKHHNFWIATDNQLVKINGSKRAYYRVKNGLTSNTIYSLGFDNDGRLWVGTINGINVFINEAFTTYDKQDGLSDNNITVFCKDTDDNMLIGTAGNGLNVYDGITISKVDIPKINQSNILCIHKTAKNEIYAGLNNSSEGLVVIENINGRYQFKRQIKGVGKTPFSTVTGLAELNDGSMIIATYGNGLWLEKNSNLTELSSDKSFTNKDIMTIYKDSKNRLWIALNRAGVLCYRDKIFKSYTTKNGLGDNTVQSIGEDLSGNIIFGNYENGITVFDGLNFKSFNKKDKLCSNNIQAVSTDKQNNLWIGTGVGLNKIKFDSKLNIVSIKLYNETNGLLGTEINQNGLFVDKSNNIWIGSNNGMTKYNPFFDYRNTTPPSLVLNNIKLNFLNPEWKNMGITTDEKSSLPINPEFNYYDNHLTFYFQALTIDHVQFTYILEPLNNEWTPLSDKNEADFTNIPPGKYNFKVKAINSDNIWSKNDYEFKFTILHPYWQTWWFRIIVGLFLFVTIVSIFKWRTAKLAKEKKILEEKVTLRTQELSVANSQLSVALHDIKDSINYAQKIQHSILPDDKDFNTIMRDAFVLFKPKDIVSGDFYWIGKKENLIIYATCDCTGHGVPGGFMTMLGTSFLNEIINEKNTIDPGKALNEIREKIIDALKQTGAEGENKDGMDMILCVIDRDKMTLTYSAANNGFYLVRNKELIELKADKQPIGFFVNHKPFSTKSISLQKGDMIYTFTDGYADQFGGPRGKKFKYKQLEETIQKISSMPLNEQCKILDNTINDWMMSFEQNDDILLIGLRI